MNKSYHKHANQFETACLCLVMLQVKQRHVDSGMIHSYQLCGKTREISARSITLICVTTLKKYCFTTLQDHLLLGYD